MATKRPNVKVGKRSSMVEVLTPEQLVEALMPWDGETLFACVRDEKGMVLQIIELIRYLEGKRRSQRIQSKPK
jgi:hypothetical protein